MTPKTIKSNVTGSTAAPVDNTLTSIIDASLGSTQGSILYRNSSVWVPLTPGTAGQILTTNGAGSNPTWTNASVGGSTVTPELFGAVGNGTTDDTVALQSFLAAAAGKTGVFTPGKNYAFKGLLFVQSNTYLIGYGSTMTALVTAGANLGNLLLTDPTEGTAVGPSNTTIAGLTINGNATARRANGSFSGVGAAANFFLISCSNCHLRDCVSIDAEGDGFYIGGDTTQGAQSTYCSMSNCYSRIPGRNCWSIVGAVACDLNGCIADSPSFGAAHSNISCGFDLEPNGSTSSNVGVTLTSCKALGCTTAGFSNNGAVANTIHCNWVSPYTQSCAIGYNAGNTGTNVRIIGARYFGNSTNFFQMSEAIASFP